MTRLRRRALEWLLRGTAFVMVITATGCTQHSTRTALSHPDLGQVRFDGPADGVNVFGEMDGMPCDANVRAAGESGFQQHTVAEEGHDGDVAVSPDGKWLLFSSTRHNTKSDIYLQRVDGFSVTQLTSDDSDDAFPVFSPDGRRIAFCSARAGNWDIYLMDLDGRSVVQVTNGPAQEMHPTFASEGSRLAYCALSGRGGQWELWTLDLSTNQKRMIGQGLFPNWSPDRSTDRIAFQRARARGSRWFSLWTLDLVEGEARRLTEIAVSSNAAVVCPVWSPDGKKLAFSTIVEPAQMKDAAPVGQQDIWITNADGTNRQRLTDGRGVNAAPFWGSDDRVYFVSDRGGKESIWSVSAKSASGSTMRAQTDADPQGKRDAVGSADTKDVEH